MQLVSSDEFIYLDSDSRYKALYAEAVAGRTNLAYGYALRERA